MNFPFKLRARVEVDVVGFGTNAVDHLIRLPMYPEFNSKHEFTSYSLSAGGEVASTLVGLQRLGFRTTYIGRFGSDANGELGRRSLADEGVDTRFAETVEGADTQVAFIIVDERNGERTILWKRDERLSYAPADVPIAAAGIGKILHLTPHDTAAAIALAKEAKRHGTIVSLDIDNVFDGVEELLPLVDCMVASAELPEKLTGASGLRRALESVASIYGCSIVAATRGIEGSMILSKGEFIETPSCEVPGGCVDTTGSGDAFRTGFLYGMLSGATVEDAAAHANAVAALKCRASGARTALPTRVELEEFIACR